MGLGAGPRDPWDACPGLSRPAGSCLPCAWAGKGPVRGGRALGTPWPSPSPPPAAPRAGSYWPVTASSLRPEGSRGSGPFYFFTSNPSSPSFSLGHTQSQAPKK